MKTLFCAFIVLGLFAGCSGDKKEKPDREPPPMPKENKPLRPDAPPPPPPPPKERRS